MASSAGLLPAASEDADLAADVVPDSGHPRTSSGLAVGRAPCNHHAFPSHRDQHSGVEHADPHIQVTASTEKVLALSELNLWLSRPQASERQVHLGTYTSPAARDLAAASSPPRIAARTHSSL